MIDISIESVIHRVAKTKRDAADSSYTERTLKHVQEEYFTIELVISKTT